MNASWKPLCLTLRTCHSREFALLQRVLHLLLAKAIPTSLGPLFTHPCRLASLQALCVAALATARMPTTRNEEYRFTDINSLLARTLAPAAPSSAAHLDVAAVCTASSLEHTPAATVVVLDGVVSKQHSHSGKLPAGVYVGSLAEAPQHVASLALVRHAWDPLPCGVHALLPTVGRLLPQGTQSCARGGMFATLNGAAARDAVVVYVPSHTVLPGPVHTLYLSSSPTVTTSAPRMAMPAATPRLLVVLEEGAMAHIVEEFRGLQAAEGAADDAGVPCGAPIKLINAVAEFELDDGAALQHSYVQLESAGSAHFKATLVNQGRESSYTLTEARMGGSLSRHDLSIAQLGDGTHSQVGGKVVRSHVLRKGAVLPRSRSWRPLPRPRGCRCAASCCVATASYTTCTPS